MGLQMAFCGCVVTDAIMTKHEIIVGEMKKL
jgi:hypothetical protein